MPGPSLAPGVHACRLAAPALLDLAGDRYFELAAPARSLFEHWATGCPLPEDGARHLVELGVISCAAASGRAARDIYCPPVPDPVISVPEHEPDGDRREPGLALMLRLYLTLGRELRLGRLERAVRGATMRRTSGARDPRALARGFLAMRRRLPFRPVCLRDSLVLTRWLRLGGAPGLFVIGVKPDPFAAHAWVQQGSCVLNDSLDHVRGFTPILIA